VNDNEILCVLTFDGMTSKAKLQYGEHSDKLSGLSRFWSKNIRNCEAGLTIHGLWGLVNGSSLLTIYLPHIQLKLELMMINSALTLLDSVGIDVVASVYDQEVTHCLLLKNLSVRNPRFM
jgi:hypothetical protein